MFYLNLDDGSREIQNNLEGSTTTALSTLDKYVGHPLTSEFEELTLLKFAQEYHGTKTSILKRMKTAVVIVRPHLSCDQNGACFEQYCMQSVMMLHILFRCADLLKNEHTTLIFRGCHRQPLYCFHFDFRYVMLIRYTVESR